MPVAAHVSQQRRVRRLAGAALLLSVSFALSRVLGLVRTQVIAYTFGDTRPVEAYFAAFRIPDTIFTLVSGAALASAFVPAFAGLIQQEREDEAWTLAATILNTVFVVFAAVAAIAWVFSPLLMPAIVPHFTPSEKNLTVELTRIMLLQPIFLGVAAILTSVLQTYHRFTWTAIAPLVYNGAVIAAALIFGPAHGISVLAWGVVAGAVLYFVVQLPGARGVWEWRRVMDWGQPAARDVLRLLAPRVVGLAAFQAMLLITLYLASSLPKGNVGAINYAWPLIQFPIGALGTAAATAIFPTLARLSTADDLAAVRRTLNRSLSLVLYLAVPSAVGLIVLRRPIINLLYYHGAWQPRATEQTSLALLFYALGLGPLAAIEVLPRVFYAMKDTATPVRIALVAVVLDAFLSVVLVHALPPEYGVAGLALATAIASALQAVWLAGALEKRLQGIGRRNLLYVLRDAACASAVMGLVLYITLDVFASVFAQHGLSVLLIVLAEVGLGAVTFGFVSYLLGAPEMAQVRSFVSR